MTTRIDARFAALRAEGRAALVTFVMAGDPDSEPPRWKWCARCRRRAPM